MKIVGLFFLVVILAAVFFFQSGILNANDALLIDNLEIAVSGGPQGTVDFGSGGDSSVEVNTDSSIKNQGDQSVKVVYMAVDGGHMWIARGTGLDASNAGWTTEVKDIDWDKYNAISVYVYGENSGSSIAFDLKDAGSEMWRYIITDDFDGWKQVVFPFDQFYARSDWQPASADNNSQMDFPVQSYQFEPLAPGKGTFYFDQVEVIKE
ncbi:MAG: hypothetical protein ISS27_02750 [Candidatus Omnitrophica bacterium]|nr:hypothetical protein [Candidatus Omnitrophota bacterium]